MSSKDSVTTKFSNVILSKCRNTVIEVLIIGNRSELLTT